MRETPLEYELLVENVGGGGNLLVMPGGGGVRGPACLLAGFRSLASVVVVAICLF